MFLQKLREKFHLFSTNIQYKCFLLLKKIVNENIRPAMLVQPADYGEATETTQ